jgi:peptidoglycan/LPS O-acetylase OafA/YrhL
VLAFQADLLEGGHLAVELFFVLTGFVVTNLLIAEDRRRGRIDLIAFAGTTTRRLLPAVMAMIVSVTVAAAFLSRRDLARVRGDGIASLFHVSNWTSIGVIGSELSWAAPFDQRSPLSHTWALAVEAQFILGWVLLVVFVSTLVPKRPAVVLVAALIGFASSASVQLASAAGSFDRWYFGTDTRSVALFVGAALAATIDPGRRRGLLRVDTFVAVNTPEHCDVGRGSRLLVELGGTAGGLFLLVLWTSVPRAAGLAPSYSLVVGAVAAAALIAAVLHPTRGPLHRVFSVGPFHWLGQISYGLYLWHWPVSVFVDADTVDLEGVGLASLRLVLTILVAVISLHLIEIPVRERQLPFTRRSGELVLRGPLGGLVGAAAMIVTAIGLAILPGGPLPADPVSAQAPPSLALVNQRTRPVIVLLGDSIFGELSDGLEEASNDYRVVDETIEFCGLVDVVSSRIGDDRIVEPTSSCREARSRWQAVVEDLRPELVLISASRWDATWKDLGDGVFVTPCGNEMQQRAARFVEGTAAVFAGTGTTVALVTLPDVREGESDTFTDCANDVYRSIAAANADVEVFDVDARFCPGHRCDTDGETVDRGEPVIDGYHFTEQGAVDVGRWILERHQPD